MFESKNRYPPRGSNSERTNLKHKRACSREAAPNKYSVPASKSGSPGVRALLKM